ncbi:hypothetical protein POPTR_007G067650v4 [Populus trichocarpa]|uniref:Uncharacterized protein n=1 Tax=Populus trichocarpa TaxID=3694 RepID=A0ACC0SPZ8_POPTR|nr:hypothetical protein POPTR_007G067650v4 [Populus trichocarpa]
MAARDELRMFFLFFHWIVAWFGQHLRMETVCSLLFHQILSYYEKTIAWFSIRSWAIMKIPERDLCSWNV